jgi:hypothetical protein
MTTMTIRDTATVTPRVVGLVTALVVPVGAFRFGVGNPHTSSAAALIIGVAWRPVRKSVAVAAFVITTTPVVVVIRRVEGSPLVGGRGDTLVEAGGGVASVQIIYRT